MSQKVLDISAVHRNTLENRRHHHFMFTTVFNNLVKIFIDLHKYSKG